MMHDTVREEMQTKISPGIYSRIETRAKPTPIYQPMATGPVMFTPPPASSGPLLSRLGPQAAVKVAQPPVISAPPLVRRHETSDLSSARTSPTLVEFQNKNASLPDWRIQLQNAVRQRSGGQSTEAVSRPVSNRDTQFPTNGGAALKAEIVQRPEPEAVKNISDPRLASAMRRIEESRRAFQKVDLQKKFAAPGPSPARPFGVVAPNLNAAAAPARIVTQPKPTLVPQPPVNARPVSASLPVSMPLIPVFKRDTSRLPQIEMRHTPSIEIAEFDIESVTPAVMHIEKAEHEDQPSEFAAIKRIRIRAEPSEMADVDKPEITDDEIEDLAPFSMRFGAGLFDLIIAGFSSMLMLSPIAFSNGDWFSTAGLLTYAATCAIVMFLYMTVCLGFSGKTLGMRLFSLELVDAAENEYPTLHQAAVNSAVYILSLIFGGTGFLTVFFNEERRAAHDLLSGTILVREF